MLIASELPAGFEVGEGMMAFLDVHKIFARTEEGRRLASQIRFAPYKPVTLSAAEWERHLGSHANTLTHLVASFRDMRKFLGVLLESGVELLTRDLESLQIAALIQGWHTQIPRIVTDGTLERRLHATVEDVLSDRESRGGRIFSAVESLGDTAVALRAWKKASVIRGTHQLHFRYLAVHVFSYQIPKLLRLSKDYIPVAAFLRKHESALSEIADLPRDEFAFFPPEGIDPEVSQFRGLEDQFMLAKAQWVQRQLPDVRVDTDFGA